MFEEKENPTTLSNTTDEVIKNITKVSLLQKQDREERSAVDHFAHLIAVWCGSYQFVFGHVVILSCWIWFNVQGITHFDPYPFPIMTLILSIEAILLSSFILMSQNLEQKVADRRANLDLQVNLLAEQESTLTLRLLEKLCKKMGVETEESSSALSDYTDPIELAQHVQRELEE